MNHLMTQLCTYCNSIADTKDHVPPKLIFPKPRPNLITVPACSSCNQQASKDDEYFRLATALEEKSSEHPDFPKVYRQIIRSLSRPEAPGFRSAFQKSLNSYDIFSQGGICVKTSHGYEVEKTRVNRVIERVTRGLFLDTFGRRLSVETSVTATPGRDFSDPGAMAFVRDMLRTGSPWRCLGNSTFCWRYTTCAEEGDTSAWLYLVFGSVSFFGITIGNNPDISNK